MITGTFKAGLFARKRFANHMLANNQIAQTAACEELYDCGTPGVEVCSRALICKVVESVIVHYSKI